MSHAHTEAQHAAHPHPGPLPGVEGVEAGVDEKGLFGRETKGEGVMVSRLCATLDRLIPALLPEAITAKSLIDCLAADSRKTLISSRCIFE